MATSRSTDGASSACASMRHWRVRPLLKASAGMIATKASPQSWADVVCACTPSRPQCTRTGHKTLQMLKRYTHLRAWDLVGSLG